MFFAIGSSKGKYTK